MRELLFLVHRIPFPPNKGDKIRSFHILRHLSRSFRVHLGTFVDDPADWRYVDEVRRYCGELCVLPLDPSRAKLRGLRGLLDGRALSLPYYDRPAMRAWVERIVRERPLAGVLVFSSAMAQYVDRYGDLRRVIDFVDVDSDKWRQYAARKPWPLSWLYAREGERLLAFDRNIATHFDHGLFVSAEEAALFRSLAPEAADKVDALENGVDVEFFDPDLHFDNPYTHEAEVIVFTGAMDYWANADAVSWFAREVFGRIRECRAQAVFYIVGARPTQEVKDLERLQGVTVTGAVPDVRPYLAHARLAVAPLRIARGVQNKVLEAMAMSRSVLASPAAVEGIDIRPGLDLSVADSVDDWLRSAVAALDGTGLPLPSIANRPFVTDRYGWARSLSRLDAYFA
jgi:sugar transferase (PEP-CTERM/EpsH1 system associated)